METREWKTGKHFPKEQKVPDRADLLAALGEYGVSEANEVTLFDTTHDADDVRLNFIVDRKYVLRFVKAPDLSERRFAELNRLIGRYRACGILCPAFLPGLDGRFLHAWENLSVYCAEYVDLKLADETEIADKDAFWDDIHDFEARFAERFRDFDLSDTVGMYSLFDLDPYDAAIGVDEKQQNFNALVKKLNALDQTALSERLSARHDAVRARLYAIYRELPRVFVQDDANESNVLVDENGRFAGLIDFNLAGPEVVVNTFANWSAGDYRITEKEPIGAAVRLESALREYRRCMDRAFSFYRATAREREAAGLYAWIAMAAQWPVFCFFDAALDAGGARRDETLELLGLIADLDPDSLRA